MDRIATVLYEQQVVGTIKESIGGYHFIYDSYWRRVGFPISFTLPLQQEHFYNPTLFPFFENMLSEGWLRQLQANQEHIDSSDSFGFLLVNGEDLPGAFTIRKESL